MGCAHLAERRFDAEEKKFAAGIQTSFFVFQAQRDLAQARTNEVRTIADHNKSLVEFEAIQETALSGSAPVTTGRPRSGFRGKEVTHLRVAKPSPRAGMARKSPPGGAST